MLAHQRPSTPRSIPYLLPASSTTNPSTPHLIQPTRLTLLSDPKHSNKAHELGRGAFGVVYAGLLDNASPVAVKAARGAPPSRDARERHMRIAARQFRREVRRYIALSTSPCIPRFYGVARLHTNPPVHVLVTERVQGGSLAQLNLQSLSADTILIIAKKLTLAVADLHRRCFSHGDLKPANILLSHNVEDGTNLTDLRVFLIDFGISRSFNDCNSTTAEEEDEEPRQKKRRHEDEEMEVEYATVNALSDEVARGAPAYLAPEAWCGEEALKERCTALSADVFALGMILYQLESGTVPWRGMCLWEVLEAVCMEGKRPEWEEESEERVKGLRRIVERCWHQDCSKRPTCRQVARALEDIQDTITETTRTASDSQSAATEPLSNFSHCTYETSLHSTPSIRPTAISTGPSSPQRLPRLLPFSQPLSPSRHHTSSPFPTMETVPVHASSPLPPPPPPPPLPMQTNIQDDSLHMPHQRSNLSLPATSNPSFSLPNQAHSFHATSTMSGIQPVDTDSIDDQPSVHQITFPKIQSASLMPSVPVVLVPPAPQTPNMSTIPSIDYAFRAEIQTNDANALSDTFISCERQPDVAVQALEALAVVAQENGPKCEQIARKGVLKTLVTLAVRYGARDTRLCKATCVLLLHLAEARRMSIDKELRVSGTPEVVLNCVKWHPLSIPVVLNACCALTAMSRSSRALRDIILALHGHEMAARALEKSAFSFDGDLGIASASFNLLESITQVSSDAILHNDVLLKVIRATSKLATFNLEQKYLREIDEKTIFLMFEAVKILPQGRDKLWQVKGCIAALESILRRAFEYRYPSVTLARGCKIVSELGQVTPLQETATIFLASDIISVIIACLGTLQTISTKNDIQLAMNGLHCLNVMTALGKDVCGSLHALDACPVTRQVIDQQPDNKNIAYLAVLFLISLLKEIKDSPSSTTNLNSVFQTLLFLQTKWPNQPLICTRAAEGIAILKDEPLPTASASSLQESLDMMQPNNRKAVSNNYGRLRRLLPRRK